MAPKRYLLRPDGPRASKDDRLEIKQRSGSVAPGRPQYAALIRAYQCTPLMERVVEALRRQTAPPAKLIVVDSSRDPAVSRAFSALGAAVVEYPPGDFNFSKAINIGVAASNQPLTLIISSHMLIHAPQLIEDGWRAAGDRGAEIVYWTHQPDKTAVRAHIIDINRRNFDGRNGLHNSMALLPTHLIRERPFREEVFSAEDQEWTKYYFKRFRRVMVRIETQEVEYKNPNHNGDTWSIIKLFNEELAIGHFVNRRLIFLDRIIGRVLRGCLATIRRRPDRAKMHFGIALAMTKANFFQPKARSKYF